MSKLIIWDKAPMINRCIVKAVDKMLRDITDSDLHFSGKVVVLRGDFRQVLPVVPRRKKEDIMKASLVFPYLWPLFVHLPLVENMRAKFDPAFYDYLLRVGNGTEEEHKQIPSQVYMYYSFDEAIDKSEQSLQEDFLNNLTSNGILSHELNLKVNCPVMLLRNINPSKGLCNRTRLTCRKFEKNVILAKIISENPILVGYSFKEQNDKNLFVTTDIEAASKNLSNL
ncbi:uncharacterized protein LOC111368378 [Olea europaea var. sylvestris]|uniref:uncharacterized protein LOC111368378 n=1 Tax=Olea europaea var. sylvestris TaxID=158386 RepID=UPI000C1D4C5A|nr:uncharacterized protein LOC111368378 [Olea europaea var. sylvestris]